MTAEQIQKANEAFAKEVNERHDRWQNEAIFPKDNLPDNFIELVSEVLRFNSPFNLRMTLDFYKQLVSHTDMDYTLMEISVIGHACKIRNADELGMSMPEYLDFQQGIENIAQQYLKMCADKKVSIEREIQATIRVEQSVPAQKKTISISMGQA